ncbi:uncharacterized protein CDV56_102455 [Aspergillus thermomutatus]|uniref:Phytanoyl-CoA dioxygenase n=1 Tax=Aspergillus thermomutatus TaxID=41047 RepID=A0A397H0B7_ASPTH|nr:uncharacterized protein CDV56_102455 [Aspergillus thermomutatus]RHZ56575.1 hypothetical protein CDV56_102455 [Aspergillus thermomutatus]
MTSSYPTSIRPSATEIKNRQLTPQNLEIAIRSLYHDGLVVVENAVPHAALDRLNEKMVRDAYALQSRKENSPYNYNRGNIQQDSPPVKDYFDRDIFLNPIATQITTTALGPRPKWTFCSGNTAMPPTADCPPTSQPVHSDADFDHPTHPFAYVVNIPLIEMTPENGSTEIWLGSHIDSGLHVQEGRHGERASGRIKLDELEKRRAIRPPCQPVVPKGAIVLRDLRLWHAGIGNQTDEVRVMLAMIHFAPWYRNPMRLEFAESVRSIMEKQDGLEVPVDWVTEEDAMSRYLNPNATAPPATPPAIAAVFVEDAVEDGEGTIELVDEVVIEVDNDAESDVVVLIGDDVDDAVEDDIVVEEETKCLSLRQDLVQRCATHVSIRVDLKPLRVLITAEKVYRKIQIPGTIHTTLFLGL